MGMHPAERRRLLWYAQDGKCLLCDKQVGWNTPDASIDHIVPKSRGGTLHIDNVALTHKRCNNERGRRLLTDEQQARFEMRIDPMFVARSSEYRTLSPARLSNVPSRPELYYNRARGTFSRTEEEDLHAVLSAIRQHNQRVMEKLAKVAELNRNCK